ncbi:MAG: DUF192 domain-containing protein [Nitrospirae bacterium]|nr:DUF192 domain-containing protein [Nitrospirota bacterium]
MKALNLTTKKELASEVTVARGLLGRMKGLLGLKEMRRGTALVIAPCKGVHTFGMRFPLDIIFLDRHNRVTAMVENLAPNRMTWFYLKAVNAIEMPAGSLAPTRTRIGDEIEIA